MLSVHGFCVCMCVECAWVRVCGRWSSVPLQLVVSFHNLYSYGHNSQYHAANTNGFTYIAWQNEFDRNPKI